MAESVIRTPKQAPSGHSSNLHSRVQTFAKMPRCRSAGGRPPYRRDAWTCVFAVSEQARFAVAFDATSDDEARARLAEKAFQRDLHVFQNEGRALWDGISEIHLRGALPKEAETWQASRAMVGQSGHVFLIPVVDPPRFDDDNDHDDQDHGD